jgi:hypothetical protein
LIVITVLYVQTPPPSFPATWLGQGATGHRHRAAVAVQAAALAVTAAVVDEVAGQDAVDELQRGCIVEYAAAIDGVAVGQDATADRQGAEVGVGDGAAIGAIFAAETTKGAPIGDSQAAQRHIRAGSSYIEHSRGGTGGDRNPLTEEHAPGEAAADRQLAGSRAVDR